VVYRQSFATILIRVSPDWAIFTYNPLWKTAKIKIFVFAEEEGTKHFGKVNLSFV